MMEFSLFPLSCANFKFETVSSPVWFKSYLYTLIVESPILYTFPSLAPIISELVLSNSSSISISASSNFFLNSPRLKHFPLQSSLSCFSFSQFYVLLLYNRIPKTDAIPINNTINKTIIIFFFISPPISYGNNYNYYPIYYQVLFI